MLEPGSGKRPRLENSQIVKTYTKFCSGGRRDNPPSWVPQRVATTLDATVMHG